MAGYAERFGDAAGAFAEEHALHAALDRESAGGRHRAVQFSTPRAALASLIRSASIACAFRLRSPRAWASLSSLPRTQGVLRTVAMRRFRGHQLLGTGVLRGAGVPRSHNRLAGIRHLLHGHRLATGENAEQSATARQRAGKMLFGLRALLFC